MIQIYGLYCPDTGELRYVGKAKDAKERLKRHISERTGKRPVNCWIRGLVDQAKAPILAVLEEVQESEWESAERRLIAEHRKTCRLLNLADGGAMPSQTAAQRKSAARASNKAQRKDSPELVNYKRAVRDMGRLHTRMLKTRSWYYAYYLKFMMKCYAAQRPELCGAWASL